MNITAYTQMEMKTFDEKSFCEIDSLVLSQFSYTFFDGFIPGINKFKRSVRLCDIYCAEHFEKIFKMVRNPEENRQLFAALAASPRFRNVKMNYYVNEIDREMEKQFSAVSYILDKKTSYISFRGTDATVVGWKEDFNMAFMDEVPAQKRAVEYVNSVAKRLTRNLIVGGHSKGGNLAVYSTVMCKPSIQKRIEKVYSHDGPGFKSLLKSGEYEGIKDRIYKTVPQSAIIGMLLENQEDYKVIKSNNQGIMQHDPFSWEIEGSYFVTLDKVTDSSKSMNKTLSDWLSEIPDDERKRVVNALFQMIHAAKVTTVYELKKLKLKDMKYLPEIASSLDTETKKFLFDVVKKLIVMSLKNI